MRNDDLLAAMHAALAAGKVILDIYASGDFGIKTKSDNSPLTLATGLRMRVFSSVFPAPVIPC